MTVKVIRGGARDWRPYRFPPRCSGALQEQWQGGDPAELQKAVADGYQQGSDKGYREGLEQGREAGHEEGLRLGRQEGLRQGYDWMGYNEAEVERIAIVGFEMAKRRKGKLCSVDKANVLETSQLWRDVVNEVALQYPEIELTHMYVDNAAMQLVRRASDFDVIVTGNLFGDILSDQASMCAGSIGMLPSASLSDWSGANGMYEPIHGSAPDIAGQGKANPCAAILSAAMLMRHSLADEASFQRIDTAVRKAVENGARTPDLGGSLTTSEMGDAVLRELR